MLGIANNLAPLGFSSRRTRVGHRVRQLRTAVASVVHSIKERRYFQPLLCEVISITFSIRCWSIMKSVGGAMYNNVSPNRGEV